MIRSYLELVLICCKVFLSESEGGMPKALQLCHFLTALFMMHIMRDLPGTR